MTGSLRPDQRVVLVAAHARNRVIGNGPDIPWRLPGEQAQFKELTWGHTLLMGRTTFESIGRPLPGRTTIVLTRSPSWTAEGVLVASSLDEALALAESLDGDVMIAGGAHVYAAALPLADEQILTEVHRAPAGDTFYPAFDRDAWVETAREAQDGYDWVWLRRVTPGRAITCSP
jgi:dihydrofolate reductase